MTSNEEKINLLNSMKVIKSDKESEDIFHVYAEYSEENLNILAKVVPDVDFYLKDLGEVDTEKSCFNLSMAALMYANAEDYVDGEFYLNSPHIEPRTFEYLRVKEELVTNEKTSLYFTQVKESAEKYGLVLTDEDFKRFFKLKANDKDIDWLMHQMSAYKKSFIDALITYITW